MEFDIQILNFHAAYVGINVGFLNVEYPSGSISDGYLTFKFRTSIWQGVSGSLTFEYRIFLSEVFRWTFDIQISISMGGGGGWQMDI